VAKFPPTTKTMKIIDHQAATAVAPAGMSMEDEVSTGERGCAADDMRVVFGICISLNARN